MNEIIDLIDAQIDSEPDPAIVQMLEDFRSRGLLIQNLKTPGGPASAGTIPANPAEQSGRQRYTNDPYSGIPEE